MKIHIIKDNSASMECLGKRAILNTLYNTLFYFKELHSELDIEFGILNWDASLTGLEEIFENCECAFILSDGYYERGCEDLVMQKKIKGKNIIILYCGSDSIVNEKLGVEASDITFAFEKMCNLL